MDGKFRVVALTGGIGSGKSAVAAYLAERGVPVYDSDSSAKALYDRDPTLVDRLEQALGLPLRTDSGALDRARLAGVIFSSPRALALVESIVLPTVRDDFAAWRDSQDPRGWRGYLGLPPFAVMESATVMEKAVFGKVYDAAVLVTAPLEQRLARACARDKASEEAVMRRIAAQKFDLSRIDAVINNDSTLELMRVRTDIAFKLLSLRIV